MASIRAPSRGLPAAIGVLFGLVWLENRGRFDIPGGSTTKETHLFSQKGHLYASSISEVTFFVCFHGDREASRASTSSPAWPRTCPPPGRAKEPDRGWGGGWRVVWQFGFGLWFCFSRLV